jgi:hypothetical protein
MESRLRKSTPVLLLLTRVKTTKKLVSFRVCADKYTITAWSLLRITMSLFDCVRCLSWYLNHFGSREFVYSTAENDMRMTNSQCIAISELSESFLFCICLIFIRVISGVSITISILRSVQLHVSFLALVALLTEVWSTKIIYQSFQIEFKLLSLFNPHCYNIEIL